MRIYADGSDIVLDYGRETRHATIADAMEAAVWRAAKNMVPIRIIRQMADTADAMKNLSHDAMVEIRQVLQKTPS